MNWSTADALKCTGRFSVTWIAASLLLLQTGCFAPPPSTPAPATPIELTLTPSLTVISPPPTVTLTPSPTSTPKPTPEPAGCFQPPDDYTRITVNGWTLNQRTLSMLMHAYELYGGEIDITSTAITQGSYNSAIAASFGTHSGGGAVDISVLRKGTYTILWEEIDPLLRALRTAGFAAWLREYGELGPDSPIHIHAIAIGDAELSPEAQAQLTGPAGYFRGYSGLVDESKLPTLDRYGGPILCQWMLDLGYQDLR